MPAPTERDPSILDEVLRREFPDWDEEDYLRMFAAVPRKRTRVNKDRYMQELNVKLERDGSCSFKDMDQWLVTGNKSQERTRLVDGTSKKYGWRMEKRGKVWFGTKEGTAPAKFEQLMQLAKRDNGVCPIQAGIGEAGSPEYTKAVEYLLTEGAEHIGSGYYKLEE